MRSSVFMSLNSLDSKISPQSLHSTNSASSSRLTICTRRCLQDCGSGFAGGEGGLEVINPAVPLNFVERGTDSREFSGIVDRAMRLSSGKVRKADDWMREGRGRLVKSDQIYRPDRKPLSARYLPSNEPPGGLAGRACRGLAGRVQSYPTKTVAILYDRICRSLPRNPKC
jgi:hypothetical protein